MGWRGLRASVGEFGQRAVAILAPIREPIAGSIVHTLPDTPRHPLAEFQQLGSFRRFWELARSCPRFRLTSEGVSKGSKVPTRECGGRSLVSGRRPAASGRRGAFCGASRARYGGLAPGEAPTQMSVTSLTIC